MGLITVMQRLVTKQDTVSDMLSLMLANLLKEGDASPESQHILPSQLLTRPTLLHPNPIRPTLLHRTLLKHKPIQSGE